MIKNFKDVVALCEKLDNRNITFTRFTQAPCLNSLKTLHVSNLFQNADLINDLYLHLKRGDFEFMPLDCTPAGNIIRYVHNYYRSWKYNVVYSTRGVFKGVNFTVVIENHIYKFGIGSIGTSRNKMTGREAFLLFSKSCKKHNIYLPNYKIDEKEALYYKDHCRYTIRSDYKYICKPLRDVYHLDIHSAWPAGVINKYPEFKPVFEELYDIDKQTAPKALGYCQSKYIKSRYANLPYYGTTWCDKQVWDLAKKLESTGEYIVLLINTDGIWYMKNNAQEVYHDENEGKEIGQWKTDHHADFFLMFSEGYYCYYENNKFNVVARGHYMYEDYIKPRTEWNLDDFIRAHDTCVIYDWNDDKGIVQTVLNTKGIMEVDNEFLEESNNIC